MPRPLRQAATLLLAALSFLLLPSPASPHGVNGPFRRQIEAVEARTDHPDVETMQGARLFAWRLGLHALYLMDSTRIDQAELAHTMLERADLAESEGDTPPDRARAARFRDEGQRLLLELLAGFDQVSRPRVAGGAAESDPDFTFHVAGDSGLLLFCIVDGDGPVRFESLPFADSPLDLETVPEPAPPLRLPYLPGGTTWVQVRVKRAPPGTMATYVELVPFGAPAEEKGPWFFVHVESGPRGQLRFRVRDENGADTPAMVTLIHKPTGALHRPEGALEFAPQMGDAAGDPVPSAARPAVEPGEPLSHRLKGPWTNHYWCVAHPFEMTLAAGEWRVQVWRGNEYVPVAREFTVAPGETTDLSIDLDRWVDMSARGWWSGDTHIHSRLMNDQDADRLLLWLEAADLQVANVVRMGNYLRTYFEQRGYGREHRVRRGNRVLVPGQEDPRYFSGHSLALNIDRPIRDMDKYLYNDWVAEQTIAAGGIYGHAHLILNMFNIRRDLVMLMPRGTSSFGEILQVGDLDTDLYYEFLNLGFKLTAAAGSDVPFGHGLGEVRYYVRTGETRLDVDEWFAAMKAGHTFVSNGPMIDLRVDDALPGDEILVTADRPLRVRARAESMPVRETALRRLVIFANGEPVREVVNDDRDVNTLELDFELPAGHGMWIAAKAENRGGTMGHTTPVYVTREGFRRWNMDQVPALLAMCNETLDGMERELLGFVAQVEGGTAPPWNLFIRNIVRMAPLQLERIAETRAFYQDLERQYRDELVRRRADAEGKP